ncbi:expressed unknown protein [Seminavis robusta]|uniref:Uncharacterized protein n=1 Tax=Seminavis robusta TaxID=568900 RepID=A0A9N8E4H3_9STRA|nr:expressed unknown protein [Seminavis robusta]|eukprot:Sro609_g175080.1 n/a (253) ;mRNA; f:39654-40609
MRMNPSARLLKFLKQPAQIANALDWKKQTKTIASLHIGRHHIGVAIAHHPSLGEDVSILHPVNLDLVTRTETNRSAVDPASVDRLERICHKHNVGGFLVCWPLQKEGRAGASCGKVLHTLESLVEDTDSVFTPSRPICLWVGGEGEDSAEAAATREAYEEDEWGRAAAYSRCCYDKTIYLASKENYCFLKGSSEFAAVTSDAFARQFWPDEFETEQEGHSIIEPVRHGKSYETVKELLKSSMDEELPSYRYA